MYCYTMLLFTVAYFFFFWRINPFQQQRRNVNIKKPKTTTRTLVFFFFSPSVYLICFVIGLMRPPVRSSPSSARSPNHEMSSGSAKCCKESTATRICRPIFGDPTHNAGQYSWKSNGKQWGSLISFCAGENNEREREHFNTSLIAHQKRQTKESRRWNFGFYLLDFYFAGLLCVLCLYFWKRKISKVYFIQYIFRFSLSWLAAVAALSENMDNSNQTPT